MTEHKIGWLNMPGYKPETWNPVIGCTEKSEGCKECFAKKMAFRLMHMPHTSYYQFVLANNGAEDPEEFRNLPEWNGTTHFVQHMLDKPLHWKEPRMVFVCDMGDLFHETVPFEWIDQVFDIIYDCSEHIFIILTKRAERMKEYIDYRIKSDKFYGHSWIWLGVTAENQEQANKRIPILLQIPAAKLFVSIEPMLGPIDFYDVVINTEFYNTLKGFGDISGGDFGLMNGPKLDWVICGGETGHKARPMHPDWVRSLRDQCKDAGVPFFFKQWGEWMDFQDATSLDNTIIPGQRIISAKMDRFPDKTEVIKVGRKYTGNLLDGQQHHNWPGSINLPTKSIHQ